MSFISRTVAACLCLVLLGCVAGQPERLAIDPRYDSVAPALQVYMERVRTGGERNAVLNWEEAGLAALELGDTDTARSAFDEALLRIESVFSDTEAAAKARSVWYAESIKDFKGEPYERAMAFFYRGLVDMWDGDYENARAMFKSGLQQDAFAEEQQNRSDFALHMFMIGWCCQMLGDYTAADEAYGQLREFRPDFATPSRDDNALVILETGGAPQKYAAGLEMSELRFRRGATQGVSRVDVRGLPAYPMEDIYWQASTRGGREVDRIVRGKAEFKVVQESVGKVMTQAGTAVMASGMRKDARKETKYVGAALTLIGISQMVMAANVDARVDARFWRNLPNRIHVVTTHVPCAATLPVVFRDGSGSVVQGGATTVRLLPAGNGFLGRATFLSSLLYGQ